VDVKLDGRDVQNPPLRNQGFHYQALNRLHCPESLQREKYGKEFRTIANSDERKWNAATGAGNNAVPQYIHPKVLAAMEPIQFDEYDANLESRNCYVTAGFDGYFPLSSQCNAMRTTTRQKNENKFLHPGARISLVLHKVNPPHACIERLQVTDDMYWGIGNVAIAAGHAHKDLTLNFVEVSITYEQVLLDETLAAEYKRRTHR
jgi:hypothetical protein